MIGLSFHLQEEIVILASILAASIALNIYLARRCYALWDAFQRLAAAAKSMHDGVVGGPGAPGPVGREGPHVAA